MTNLYFQRQSASCKVTAFQPPVGCSVASDDSVHLIMLYCTIVVHLILQGSCLTVLLSRSSPSVCLSDTLVVLKGEANLVNDFDNGRCSNCHTFWNCGSCTGVGNYGEDVTYYMYQVRLPAPFRLFLASLLDSGILTALAFFCVSHSCPHSTQFLF